MSDSEAVSAHSREHNEYLTPEQKYKSHEQHKAIGIAAEYRSPKECKRLERKNQEHHVLASENIGKKPTHRTSNAVCKIIKRYCQSEHRCGEAQNRDGPTLNTKIACDGPELGGDDHAAESNEQVDQINEPEHVCAERLRRR